VQVAGGGRGGLHPWRSVGRKPDTQPGVAGGRGGKTGNVVADQTLEGRRCCSHSGKLGRKSMTWGARKGGGILGVRPNVGVGVPEW